MENLCGRCNKEKRPKDVDPMLDSTEWCHCGRPTLYKEEYVAKVDDYLEEHQDKDIQVVKQSSDKYEMYDNKLKVKLPTIEGFAGYIGVNKTTLYEWESNNEKFSNALDKIRVEQQTRLINEGLAGNYNSTIAKLILSSNHGMRERNDVTTDGKAIKGNSIVFSNFKGDE